MPSIAARAACGGLGQNAANRNPAVRSAPPAPVTPLSHHEILGLVEPFTRAGRHVNLAASDRAARRLSFKPVDHAAAPNQPALQEVLQLECPPAGPLRLTRTLRLPSGLLAVLISEGKTDSATPAELLARVLAIPLQRQFLFGPGHVVAKTLKFEAASGAPDASAPLLLSQATAQLDGLLLRFKLSPVKGISAEIELESSDGETLALPDDLLAVLGWSWARLVKRQAGWTTRLRLRGDGFKRSRDAESKLELAVLHLAKTLAEPPARFHDQRVGTRWGVVARRMIPLLGAGLMIVAAAVFAKLEPDLAQDSVFRMLIFHAPPILMVAFFCMNELPRVEIPPLPRRPREASWRRPRLGSSTA